MAADADDLGYPKVGYPKIEHLERNQDYCVPPEFRDVQLFLTENLRMHW